MTGLTRRNGKETCSRATVQLVFKDGYQRLEKGGRGTLVQEKVLLVTLTTEELREITLDEKIIVLIGRVCFTLDSEKVN